MKFNAINRKSRNFIFQLFCIMLGILVALPVLYALSISFMPANQIMKRPPKFFPNPITLKNYVMVLTLTTLVRFMWNSFVIAGISSTVRVLSAAMASYAFAFFKFKGRDLLFLIVLGTIMVPADIVLVTNYQTVARMHLINTYLGMMIIFLCSANNIFLLRQHFLSFPMTVKEAATIDGCGNFRFFVQILLPLSTPAMATVFLSAFIGTWNTYLWPMLVTNENSMRTVQVGVTMMNFPDAAVYGPVMAASILVLLPALVIFVIFENKIVGGIMGGAIKE